MTSSFVVGTRSYICQGRSEERWRCRLPRGMEKHLHSWNVWGLAEIYAALGDKDRAIYFLEEAYRMRQDFIPWIRYDNNLAILRDDPRFKDIVSRLNLPE
ncbi:MAG: tetratricopeptide repeat protein [Marinilabiliales bacterium]|nr:tetratricopeptide repeat protein [Marinilabiliales bacterium]